MENKIKDKTVSFNTWLSVCASLGALVLSTLLLGLMDFDFSAIFTLKYWTSTLVTTITGVFVYSTCYFTFISKERNQDNTVYAVVAKEHYNYLRIVRKNKLRSFLIPKVEEENARRKEEKKQRLLSKYGIKEEELEDIKANGLKNHKYLCKWYAFKQKREIKRLARGIIDYTYFTIDEILNDKDEDNDNFNDEAMSISPKYHERVIVKKMFKTILFSLLISSLCLKSFDKQFIEILIKNATVIGSNLVTSSMTAKSYIKARKIILENSNSFFAENIPNEFLG